MLVILDTLDLMVEISTDLGATEGSTPQVLSASLRILLHMLSKRQGVEVLQHAFALQRAIVAKVRSVRTSMYCLCFNRANLADASVISLFA